MAFKAIQKELLATPYYNPCDPNYKSLQFNRYADDFAVGIIGSREDAERVKADIRDFLADTLKLTLSEEKTKVTHSSELIDFLGYQFTVRRSREVKRDKNGILRRLWYGRTALYVPHNKWVQKLRVDLVWRGGAYLMNPSRVPAIYGRIKPSGLLTC